MLVPGISYNEMTILTLRSIRISRLYMLLSVFYDIMYMSLLDCHAPCYAYSTGGFIL